VTQTLWQELSLLRSRPRQGGLDSLLKAGDQFPVGGDEGLLNIEQALPYSIMLSARWHKCRYLSLFGRAFHQLSCLSYHLLGQTYNGRIF